MGLPFLSHLLICVWTKEQSTRIIPTTFTITVQFKKNISIMLASLYVYHVEKMTHSCTNTCRRNYQTSIQAVCCWLVENVWSIKSSLTKAPTLLPPQIIKPKIMMLKFILVYIWHEKIALKIQAQFLSSAYCHSCKTIQTSFLSSLQNTQLFYWVTLYVIKQNAILLKNWLWP